MSFSVSWQTLRETLEELPSDTALVTPRSRKPFRVTDIQEPRVLISYREGDETIPLDRNQFETLAQRIKEAHDGFDLNQLPSGAGPYATVLSLHPRFELDDREGTLTETDTPTASPLVDAHTVDHDDSNERDEPNLPVYADALLLIDALERHDPTELESLETPVLVNMYTLLSDVQRNANDLRQDVRATLLERLHHDQPVSGQYGSVQRTSRRNRTLKADDEVLERLDAEGIDRERITSVDSSKVDEALEVTNIAESEVYEITESEYVRKADVDEAEKESRLQGLKDQLAATDTTESEELRSEIEALETRIDELTSFQPGSEYTEQD